MKSHEITEPGYYWNQIDPWTWKIIFVDKISFHEEYSYLDFYEPRCEVPAQPCEFEGEFYGPISPPFGLTTNHHKETA